MTAADLVLPPAREGSAEVLARVIGARDLQRKRFANLGLKAGMTNSSCSGQVLEQVAAPDHEGGELLKTAANSLGLSARGFHRTLRVARTLADLDGTDKIGRPHIAEALSYRGEVVRQREAA